MSETRDYARLKCVAFGKALVTSQDLDPVYAALHRAKLPAPQLARLLVAYWCLYHLGCAASLSELKETKFWEMLALAAANMEDRVSHRVLPPSCAGRWPRGTERRHWRGLQSVKSFASVREKASYRGGVSAEHLVDYLAGGGTTARATFRSVTERVQELRGFGPWIAFKVADMLERVGGHDISFEDCLLGFYDEPRKGAWLYMNEGKRKPLPLESCTPGAVGLMVHKLLGEVGRQFAPPDFKRKLGVQEAETIFCKWKSHLGGHYALGKDTREVFHGLEGWGDLADTMRVKLLGLPYCPAKAAGKGGSHG